MLRCSPITAEIGQGFWSKDTLSVPDALAEFESVQIQQQNWIAFTLASGYADAFRCISMVPTDRDIQRIDKAWG